MRVGAQQALARHRERGDVLALLTSSSLYLSEAVQQQLGITHVCCNRFEVEEGVFTGKAVMPLCFGAGKLDHA